MIGRSTPLIDCLDADIEQRRSESNRKALSALYSIDALRLMKAQLTHAIENGDNDLRDQLDEVNDAIAQIEDPAFNQLEGF